MAHNDPLMQPLLNGSALLKIASSGKPAKRHVFVTEDLQFLKWAPSRRKLDNDFVHVGAITSVRAGKHGARFDRFGGAEGTKEGDAFLHVRARAPTEVVSGWLEKMGGAKGGHAGWTRRWCVLGGTNLAYYGSPSDAVPKGEMDLAGAVVEQLPLPHAVAAPGEGDVPQAPGFRLTWNARGGGAGGPPREFRAESKAAATKWVLGLRRQLAMERCKTALARGLQMAKAPLAGMDLAGAAPTQPLCFSVYHSSRSGGGSTPGSVPPGGGPDGSSGAGTPASGLVSFVAGSVREYEAWYGGLLALTARRARLNAAAREAKYRAMCRANPTDAVARVALGMALEEGGNAPAAAGEYKLGTIIEPLLASARKAFGRLLLRGTAADGSDGDAAAALPQLEAALALSGREDAEAAALLGDAQLAVGNAKAAVVAFEHALALDPKFTAAAAGAGDAHLRLGKVDEALKFLQNALSGGGGSGSGAGHLLTPSSYTPLRMYNLAADALLSTVDGAGGGRADEAVGCLAEAVEAAEAEVDVAKSVVVDDDEEEEQEAEGGSAASGRAALASARAALLAAQRRLADTLVGLKRWREATVALRAIADGYPDNVDDLVAAAGAYYEVSLAPAAASAAGGARRNGVGAAHGGKGGKGKKEEEAKRDDDDDDDDDGGHRHGGDDDEDAAERDDDGAAGDDGDEEEDEEGEDGDGRERGKGAHGRGGKANGTSASAKKGAKGKGGKPAPSSQSALAPLPRRSVPAPGSLPLDALSPLAVAQEAEALLVRALTLDAASPPANILCGKVYERLAALEREAAAAAAAGAGAGGDSAPAAAVTGDELAPSGWTPNQRLDKAAQFYEYISLAYADPVFVEAPLRSALLHKAGGRFQEALDALSLVLERVPGHAEAADLKARCGRLAAGQPEFPVAAAAGPKSASKAKAVGGKKGKGEEEITLVGAFGDGDGPLVPLSADMTKEERDKAFFAGMAAKKKADEEEKARKEAAKLSSMNEEEKKAHEAAKKDAARHDVMQKKALTKGMNDFKGSKAASLLAGGRGRGGRGRGRGGRGGSGGGGGKGKPSAAADDDDGEE